MIIDSTNSGKYSFLQGPPGHSTLHFTFLTCQLLFIPAFLRNSSFLTLPTNVNPTILPNHFISSIFTLLLFASVVPQASAPYCTVGTIILSYIRLLQLSVILYFSTLPSKFIKPYFPHNQKWPCETHSVTYVPGLSTLSDLTSIDAQPPPSFLCCPRPPSHHPSSLTSVSLVPALHLLPHSTSNA